MGRGREGGERELEEGSEIDEALYSHFAENSRGEVSAG